MNAKTAALMLLGICLAAPAGAADADDADKAPASDVNKGSDAQAAKLAAEFKVPASEISGLRAQGMGWGEIRHALAIARKADVPVGDVLKLRESGMGWGQITRKYGFPLGAVTGKGRPSSTGEAGKDQKEKSEPRERRELRQDHRERGPHSEGIEHGRPGGGHRGRG